MRTRTRKPLDDVSIKAVPSRDATGDNFFCDYHVIARRSGKGGTASGSVHIAAASLADADQLLAILARSTITISTGA